jgi:hypothetical protein
MGDRRVILTLAVLAAALVPAASASADPLAPPSNLVGPQSPGNDTTPAWTWGVDPTATSYECHLELDGAVPDWQPCVSGAELPAITTEGLYHFGVRALVGVVPGGEAADTYTLDTTAPAAPVVTGGPTGEISGESASFSFTSEPGAATQCRLARGSTVVYDWATCPSPWAYGFTGQPDGSYTFSVRATDAAGNTGAAGTRSFTLARPAPPTQSSAPPELTAPPELPVTPTGPVLRAGVCINLFNGTPGADKLSGSPFGDVLIGFAGNDDLSGLAGNDCVLGDAGNDRLSGGSGDDDVRGLAGNDQLSGDAGNDQLSGGPGEDTLIGGPGTDTLRGGPGNDYLNAADGRRETVSCGPGIDSVTADRVDRLSGCEKKRLRGRKP